MRAKVTSKDGTTIVHEKAGHGEVVSPKVLAPVLIEFFSEI